MTPLVSVLLPVRNAAGHLPMALESLAAQTLKDHEVIAVDDGSDDGGQTAAVLAAHGAADPRVRHVSPGRLGIARALNLAASLARGRYLARMDADDWSLPMRLERQAAFLDAHPDVDAAGCLVRYGGDPASCPGYARHVDWLNTLADHESMALGAFRDAPIAHPSAMFRASSFSRLGGYRHGPFPEDFELWLRWLHAGARLGKAAEELLVWNDPPDRLSRTEPRYSQDAFHRVKAVWLAAWLRANNPRHPDVHVVGAGRVTRRRVEHLVGQGVRVVAYLDIDPRKIGRSHQGVPVLPHEAAPPPGKGFVVSYVATPGAAEHVARFLEARGCRAGLDYVQAG